MTAAAPPADAIDPRVALLRTVGDRAARLTLEYFQHPELTVDHKADLSPVTAADLACETLIRQAILESFPQDAILGEEHGDQPGSTGFRWIIDPIDGTVSFARGVPLYGVLIALEFEGADGNGIVAGTCELPALGERVWAATGRGAWWDRAGRASVRARVAASVGLRDALVATTGIEYFRRAGTERALQELEAGAGRVRGWSDCYSLALAATGRCDAAVEPLMNPWDSGPFPVIFAEAGGTFTSWDGTADIRRPTAIAAGPALHAELVELLRPHAGS